MKTGALVDIMSGTSYIVVRSILSKTVPPAELGTWTVVRLGNRADDDGILRSSRGNNCYRFPGQVSAVVAVIETLVPIVYKPMYSAIYRSTVNTFSGAFYVVGSIMLVPSVFLYW